MTTHRMSIRRQEGPVSNRHRRAAAVLASAAVLVLGAAEAGAYRMIQNTSVGRVSAGAAVSCSHSGGFTHWNKCGISWRLNTANQGSGKQTAVQNAMASWTNVSSACYALSYAGTTTAGFVTDGINTLRWATGEGCSGGCLALTALVLASGQVITETDVTFNNAYSWNTNGSDYDVEAIAAHEFGHTLGIHHTNLGSTPRPTMYAYYFGTGGRSLEADDRSALQCAQSRYPPASLQAPQLEDQGEEAPGPAAGPSLSVRPGPAGALVRFSLAGDAEVRLDVFDVAGRHVATLAEGRRAAGDHELSWDGGGARAGVYFARLWTPSATARSTVVLR